MNRGRLWSIGFAVALAALVLPSVTIAADYAITDLGSLGDPTSQGYGLSANGLITGNSYLAFGAGDHAFLYDGAMHDLGTLGFVHSTGHGINDNAQVTGTAHTSLSPVARHAFLYDGTMHDLGTLGGTNSEGWSINGSGQVVGMSQTTGDLTVLAFLYDGSMHALGTLGGTNSRGYGINDSGHVTGGASTVGNAALHAFLYDGTMHDLGTLGGTNSQGWSINGSGQVTGYASTAAGMTHAFIYDGAMHDLGTLGGTTSVGYGINSSGQVTGTASMTGDAAQHAFLYDPVDGMLDLNAQIDPVSGWVLTDARAINDRGQITGWGTFGGETHAFLLTPVPEPSALLLAAAGLGALLLSAGRHRRVYVSRNARILFAAQSNSWSPRMNTRPLLILVVVAAVLTSWINPLGAAIVTCQFSGDRIGSLALLDPGFEDSDPFSGTLIYETSTPESSSPGQPLAITLSVDGAPSLSWTAPASYDGTYIQYGFDAGPSGAVDIIGFKKGGTPALAAFNDFVVTSLRVEFYFEYDTLPSDLSDFDPLSPHIVERLLLVNFRHSNEEMESFYSAPSITEFSVVPEPSALALAACAAPGMAAVFRRRRTKRLVLPTAR